MGDPLFVDPAAGDFHLRVHSPAIDAGIDVGLAFLGGSPDKGAYEFVKGRLYLPIATWLTAVAVR